MNGRRAGAILRGLGRLLHLAAASLAVTVATTAVDARSQTPDGGVAPAPEVTAVGDRPGSIREDGPRRCRRYRRHRFCDGPLQAPAPQATDAERAAALGIGTDSTAAKLFRGQVDPRWVEAAAQAAPAPDDRFLWPVADGRLWRGMQPRRGRSHGHAGVDIGAPAGATIRAARPGLVAYVGTVLRGYGNAVLVVHTDGSVGLYAHLRAAWVSAGALLGRGTPLGEVGHTGLAHGDHLHFEWRVEGRPDDPMPRFDRVLTGPVPRTVTPPSPSDVHGTGVNEPSRDPTPGAADPSATRDST